jgi:hypothetical protein
MYFLPSSLRAVPPPQACKRRFDWCRGPHQGRALLRAHTPPGRRGLPTAGRQQPASSENLWKRGRGGWECCRPDGGVLRPRERLPCFVSQRLSPALADIGAATQAVAQRIQPVATELANADQRGAREYARVRPLAASTPSSLRSGRVLGAALTHLMQPGPGALAPPLLRSQPRFGRVVRQNVALTRESYYIYNIIILL